MSGSEKSSSRRDFLRKMIVLVPTFSIAACAPLSALRITPEQVYSPRYFTGEEWAFLHAACAPADFIDWVDKYGTRYPLDPVAIAGKKG